MKPTGRQISRLQAVLINAFDYAGFRQMLRKQLDEDIEKIAPVANANLNNIVYAVIRHYAAEAGGLHKLAAAAHAENSRNVELAKITAEFLAIKFDPLPSDVKPPWDKAVWVLITLMGMLLALIVGLLVYQLMPKPMAPTGYNVAVATFGAQDETGAVRATDVSREISDWFFAAVENDVKKLPTALQYDLRGPADIGVITGDTPEARAAAARQVADKFNAAVLIYGQVFERNGEQYVQPEFYVSDQDTFFYADALIGPNRLGAPIPFRLPLDAPAQAAINQQLDARRRVLQHVLIGLGYFFIDDYAQAELEFRTAASDPGWPDEAGKEIAYLLIGAAALRQYDVITRPEPLDDAELAFQRAYQINENFARAHLGLGIVALERAQILNHERTEPETVNGRFLADAGRWYASGRDAPDQLPSEYVALKADFGLGQVFTLGFQFGVPGYALDKARGFFQNVITAVSQSEPGYLNRFEALAHGGMGWVAALDQDFAGMAEEYRTANAIWESLPAGQSERDVARNWSRIGYAELQMEHLCNALEAYRMAVTIGEAAQVGEGELDLWQQHVADLEQKEACLDEH
jgi:hypothetical protein